jgi:hypothetical protein
MIFASTFVGCSRCVAKALLRSRESGQLEEINCPHEADFASPTAATEPQKEHDR